MKTVATLHIEAVEGCRRRDWYDEYRRLRYRIFVLEQGWSGLRSETEAETTREDPADDRARFWLARSAAGTLIGAVRVRSVSDVFPHRELFQHHLRRREMASVLPWMGTLNSLAVIREGRGRIWRGENGQLGTAARLLLRTSLAGCADVGLAAIVATAQNVVSAKALVRAGFRVIDPPVLTPLHATFLMCNLGIVMRTRGQAEEGDEGSRESANVLAKYFEARERRILGSKPVDELFLAPAGVPVVSPARGDSPLNRDRAMSNQ